MITEQQYSAARHCIECGIPFALFALPGRMEFRFLAASQVERIGVSGYGMVDDSFVIHEFDKYSDAIRIAGEYDEFTLFDANIAGCRRPLEAAVGYMVESDSYDDYCRNINEVIESLKASGGKTVMSRVKAVRSDCSPLDVACRYFQVHQHTMRYLYFTPLTGLWFGASPELLLEYSYSANTLSTIALAGTLAADSAGAWDKKNVEEHEFVTGYICGLFKSCGLEPVVGKAEERRFGAVKHLAHTVTAGGDVNVGEFMQKLSPTPALLGTPYEQALQHVKLYESRPRGCYGGWIGYFSADGLTAYVNLRCAQMAKEPGGKYIYNIFTGGGITALSSAPDEWNETECKAKTLIESII